MTIPAMTTNRMTGHGLVISPSPISEWPTNSVSMAKIMKTFHSRGTPIGMADRMPRWKHTITKAAMAVGQPPWLNNSTRGTPISMAVLTWARARDSGPGRRSSGKFSKNLRLSHRARTTGLLDIIVEMTNGKCLLSLEVAAPIQITTQASLAAIRTLGPPNRKAATNGTYTSPRIARKRTLSRRPATATRARIVQDCHAGSRPMLVPSAGSGPVPSENSATTSIISSAP